MISPKESGEYIASRASNVKIKAEGIKKFGDTFCEEVKSGKLSPSNFGQTELHPSSKDPWALDWILIVNTLNYCLWPAYRWRVNGYRGSFAICAAVSREMKNNDKFLDPKFYSTISIEDLSKIFQGDSPVKLPLLSERIECLHEVGKVLLENYDGSFEKLVKEADGSAKKLLHLIVGNFKCFRDEATYQGRKVGFYKRAQNLIGDIWACFENKGLGHFKDINEITMFADYRVPQALVYFNCLEYSESLLTKLRKNTVLQNGGVDEVEIRGCTIHAVELLKEHISKQLLDNEINSILIDHFLWDFRRKHAQDIGKKKIEFHRIFCIYY